MPKNAIIKQYKKLFGLENVNLKFTDGAIKAIAQEAVARKLGARGLRSILERAMLNIMYEVPGNPEIEEVVVNEEAIRHAAQPIITLKKKAG